jgi:hypothetical protein
MTRILTTLLGAALLLPACGGDAAKKTDAKVADAKKSEAKPDARPDVKPAPDTKKSDAPPAADPLDGKVQLAATIAREIAGAPEQADEILGKHGLDRDKFDAMIFEIAGDPELTRKYMAARKAS